MAAKNRLTAKTVALPAQRGEVKRAVPLSQRDPRRSFIQGEARIGKVRFANRHSPLAFVFPQKRKGRRNAGKRRVTTAASCDAARALLERARLTAFHHGSHLRELFHPKGSASGQASWDVV
jgi:hypothetical protein